MRIFTYSVGPTGPSDAKKRQELNDYVHSLKPGEYIVTIKKNRAIRSLSANKYYHCILNIIAIDTGFTHEELHEALKMKFNSKIVFFPKGGSQMISKTTSDLDSAEFAAYINQVKHWALNEFGIVIPEEKDVDYQRWLEIENTYEQNQIG